MLCMRVGNLMLFGVISVLEYRVMVEGPLHWNGGHAKKCGGGVGWGGIQGQASSGLPLSLSASHFPFYIPETIDRQPRVVVRHSAR